MIFTTIYHPLRKRLGLTCNEYCVADLIRVLSGNPGSPVPGWCTASRGYLADELDMSRQTVITIIKRLVELDIVVEVEATKHVRASQSFFDDVVGAQKEPVKKLDRVSRNFTPEPVEGCKETLQGVKKVDTPCQETLQAGVKNLDTPPVKKLDTIYIEDISIVDIDINNKEREGADAPTSAPTVDVVSSTPQKTNEAPGGAATKPLVEKVKNHRFALSPYYDRDTFVAALAETEYAIYDIAFYHETLKNWADGGGHVRVDWLAVGRGFMTRDAQKNQARLRAGLQPQQSFTNGNQPNARPVRQSDAEFANSIDALAEWKYRGAGRNPEARTGADTPF